MFFVVMGFLALVGFVGMAYEVFIRKQGGGQ